MTDVSTPASELFIPEPRTPWRNPRKSFISNAITVVSSAFVAVLVYALTGLDGLLGWYVSFVLGLLAVVLVQSIIQKSKHFSDRIASILVTVGFASVLIPWISLITTVIERGRDAIYTGFFTRDMLVNSMDEPLNMGGISHAIVGTLIIVGISTLVAAPLGIIAAIYIVEINGKAARTVRFLTQAMSGVPSIVAGLFIYSTVVITITHKNNALAGALALSVLMLPTVARTSEEVLKVVPRDIRDSSYALGATQFRTTIRVVLPTVRSGLITATILGVARVAGETAPLLLTSQYFVKMNTSLFTSPMASLPTYVFGALRTGTELSLARAWGGSLVLISIVVLLSVIARLLSGRTAGRK
jgi:phosphate transport system permease protein